MDVKKRPDALKPSRFTKVLKKLPVHKGVETPLPMFMGVAFFLIVRRIFFQGLAGELPIREMMTAKKRSSHEYDS